MPKPAVVLLSGGLDSSTVVALAQRDGFEVHALSFSYGQRHTVELEAAKEFLAAEIGRWVAVFSYPPALEVVGPVVLDEQGHRLAAVTPLLLVSHPE